jgi:hypothetical protein
MRRMTVLSCQFHIMQVSPCRISGGQSGSGASILWVLQCSEPCYSANALHTCDIMCCYNRSILGFCIKGPCPTTHTKNLKEVWTHIDVHKEHINRLFRNATSSEQRKRNCKMKPEYFEQCGRVKTWASDTSKSEIACQRNCKQIKFYVVLAVHLDTIV